MGLLPVGFKNWWVISPQVGPSLSDGMGPLPLQNLKEAIGYAATKGWPQPGHFTFLPMAVAGTFSFFWQLEQVTTLAP
jgi:hypothetical protein